MLVAAKVGVFKVRKPFEWVGELATGVLSMTVAALAAFTYYSYAGQLGLPVDFVKPGITPMISPGAWAEYWQLLMPVL